MIDFKKLNTPEAREEMKQRTEARDKMQREKDKATRFMLDYLIDCDDLNDYENEFIASINGRFSSGVSLTEKQAALLDKLFHNH